MRTVNRGVALLDAQEPGWYNKVDVATIDLTSSTRCILGQVYGHYHRGLHIFGNIPTKHKSGSWLEKYGFNPDLGMHTASKKAWAKAIHKRRLQQAQTEQYMRTLSKGFVYPNIVVQETAKEDALCSS